jgi:hypothetical protein
VNRRHREERSDDADPQRQRATLDELARDARLLRGRGGVDLAQDRGDLALRAFGTVDEGEDADDQSEQREEREEDPVGNGAREKAAVVGDK